MRLSRASWSGSSWSRRSPAAFSLASRARSRPACAPDAVFTGDHLCPDPMPRHMPLLLHKPEATPTSTHRTPSGPRPAATAVPT
ncbi:hypothetical protein DDE18_21440 [Nocardioides gansuensis]|uniref:Uncharacterized protein n=1 Tax=Nocardioides gansuensis TaxID=2138300 RepID=A0A2T8F534_9ACTN|nr:hypothetical protein DDE18_21440 [Nocardioides gansuensis]